jgi:hypothetical protein
MNTQPICKVAAPELILEAALWRRPGLMCTVTTGEYVTPELTRLLDIARQELDRHLCDHGVCCRCQEHWPCPTACLAAETLEGL